MTDRILVTVDAHEGITPAMSQFADYIKSEVLADSLEVGDTTGGVEVELPGDVQIHIKVQKA